MTVSSISTGLVITASDVLILGKSAVITASRAAAAASGDVAYTGVGFQPRTIIAFGRVSPSNGITAGFAAQSLSEYDIHAWKTASNEPSIYGEEAYLVSLYNAITTNYQKATLKTMDSDGFTLNWESGGGGAGGQIDFLCLG